MSEANVHLPDASNSPTPPVRTLSPTVTLVRPFIIYDSYKPRNLEAAKEYVNFVLAQRFIPPNLLDETDPSEKDSLELPKRNDYDFMSLPKGLGCMQEHLRLEREKRKDGRMVSYLCFDSMFECGNLSKAIALSPTEYDLYLSADTNSAKQVQWFYFAVTNTKKNRTVRFNIKNQTKHPHFYQKGMKPLVFSEKDYNNIYATWTCHVDNLAIAKGSVQKLHGSLNICLDGNEQDLMPSHDTCYNLSFTHTFKHDNDKVYFAYNRPYSFTRLNSFLEHIESKLVASKKSTSWIRPELLVTKENLFYKREILCYSLGNLPVYSITVTGSEANIAARKKHIVITARVHSSETSSSCKVQGILNFLLSSHAAAEGLRSDLVFVIVPMLNPDGVVLGNSRCSLGGYDLNRCWDCPSACKQPTVFAVKQRLRELVRDGKEIFVYCDLHAHSKLLNSFIYACYKTSKGNLCEWAKVRLLPRVLACRCHLFDYHQCSFKVESDKVNTARVVVWKEFKVTNSFTMESSMFAYVLGSEIVMFQERDYERLGEDLMNALHEYMKVIETMQAEFIDDKEWLKPGKLAKLTGILAADQLRLEIQEDKMEERKRRLRNAFKVRTQKAHSVPKEVPTLTKTCILQKAAQCFNSSAVRAAKPSTGKERFDQTKLRINSSSEFTKELPTKLPHSSVNAMGLAEDKLESMLQEFRAPKETKEITKGTLKEDPYSSSILETNIGERRNKRQVVLQKIKTQLTLDLERTKPRHKLLRVESAADSPKPEKAKTTLVLLRSPRHSTSAHKQRLAGDGGKKLNATAYSGLCRLRKNGLCMVG